RRRRWACPRARRSRPGSSRCATASAFAFDDAAGRRAVSFIVRSHHEIPPPSRIDTTRHSRYVPSVALRIVEVLLGLWLAGCALYVLFSYVHAFWHRHAAVPLTTLVTAALRELLACTLLLPFWPLWLILGASYEAEHEGEHNPDDTRHNPVILLHGFG